MSYEANFRSFHKSYDISISIDIEIYFDILCKTALSIFIPILIFDLWIEAGWLKEIRDFLLCVVYIS